MTAAAETPADRNRRIREELARIACHGNPGPHNDVCLKVAAEIDAARPAYGSG